MAFQPVNNTVMITLVGQRLGHEEINTFYVQRVSGGGVITTTMLQSLLLYWAGQIVPSFLTCVSGSYNAIELKARDLTTSTSAQASRLLGTGFGGSRDNVCNPGNCSLGLQRKTGTPGRPWHGRIELPSLGKIDVQNDTITNTLRDIVLTFLIQMLINHVAPDGTNWRHVHASRDQGVSAPILAWAFNTITDSQSTRLTQHGT